MSETNNIQKSQTKIGALEATKMLANMVAVLREQEIEPMSFTWDRWTTPGILLSIIDFRKLYEGTTVTREWLSAGWQFSRMVDGFKIYAYQDESESQDAKVMEVTL